MNIIITGGCGFVGSNLAIYLKKKFKKSIIYSIDNLHRKGSNINENRLKKNGIKNFRFDIKNSKKILSIPKSNLIIDCCAEPSVEASKHDTDRVIYTNLIGTYNIIKKSLKDNSNIIFLSSSRVYSIYEIKKNFLKFAKNKNKLKISETFNTYGIKSLYGFSKLSSEQLIEEFSYLNKDLKYIINRFGVISGPWQFGKQDQGFVTLWVAKHILKKKLNLIGFNGTGMQARDIIHIQDVCEIIFKQIKKINKINNQIFNIGGGEKNYINLNQLTKVCEKITNNKLETNKISKTSIYDIPYFLTDNTKIKRIYNWLPKKNINNIIFDIYFWLKKNKKILNLF